MQNTVPYGCHIISHRFRIFLQMCYVFTELILLEYPFPVCLWRKQCCPIHEHPLLTHSGDPFQLLLRTIELKYPPLHLRSVLVYVMCTDTPYIYTDSNIISRIQLKALLVFFSSFKTANKMTKTQSFPVFNSFLK